MSSSGSTSGPIPLNRSASVKIVTLLGISLMAQPLGGRGRQPSKLSAQRSCASTRNSRHPTGVMGRERIGTCTPGSSTLRGPWTPAR